MKHKDSQHRWKVQTRICTRPCPELDLVTEWLEAKNIKPLRTLHVGNYFWNLEAAQDFHSAILVSSQPKDDLTVELLATGDRKPIHIQSNSLSVLTPHLVRDYPNLKALLCAGVSVLWAHWQEETQATVLKNITAFLTNTKVLHPLLSQKTPAAIVMTLPDAVNGMKASIQAQIKNLAANQQCTANIETYACGCNHLLLAEVKWSPSAKPLVEPVAGLAPLPTIKPAPVATGASPATSPAPASSPITSGPRRDVAPAQPSVAPALDPPSKTCHQSSIQAGEAAKSIHVFIRTVEPKAEISEILSCLPKNNDYQQWTVLLLGRFIAGRSQIENYVSRKILQTLLPNSNLQDFLREYGAAISQVRACAGNKGAKPAPDQPSGKNPEAEHRLQSLLAQEQEVSREINRLSQNRDHILAQIRRLKDSSAGH